MSEKPPYPKWFRDWYVKEREENHNYEPDWSVRLTWKAYQKGLNEQPVSAGGVWMDVASVKELCSTGSPLEIRVPFFVVIDGKTTMKVSEVDEENNQIKVHHA